ncbi:MAG: hypothetical protein P1T08_18440 [Acidimicrobiia bacterium]|nr:hypothetical protein [Acidimicrobiia bacterium]
MRLLVVAVLSVFVLTGAGVAEAATWSLQYDLYRTGVYPLRWAYRHQVLWTGNGSTISAHSVTDNKLSSDPGWTFTDMADDDTFTYTSGGVQYKRKQTNASFKFGICPACLDDHPWVESTVGAGGQHWMNGSGY